MTFTDHGKKRKIEKLTEPVTMELIFGEIIGLRRDIFEINKRQKVNEDTIDRVENMLDQSIGAMIVDIKKDIEEISDTVNTIENGIITSCDIDEITKKVEEFEEKTMGKFSEIEIICNNIETTVDDVNYTVIDVCDNTINMSKHFGVNLEIEDEDEDEDENKKKKKQIRDYGSIKQNIEVYERVNEMKSESERKVMPPNMIEMYAETLSDLKKRYDATFPFDTETALLKNMKFLENPSQEEFIKEFGVLCGAEIYKGLVDFKMKN